MFEQSSHRETLNNTYASNWERKIVPLRQRADIQNRWLEKKINTVLPLIMNREGIDLWIISAREYNEDPVLKTMLPPPMMTARRRTMIVFYKRPDGTIEKMGLVRPGTGLDRLYTNMWTNQKGSSWAGNQSAMHLAASGDLEKGAPETQFECLARLIRERDPKSIGINVSPLTAFGDGLTKNEYDEIVAALDPQYVERLKPADKLCVGWLETRIPEELEAYNGIMQIAHGIIAEAFSSRVTHPGISTADDVQWWMTQRVAELTLENWFNFEVSIRRQGTGTLSGDELILPGDILHCDIGLRYLGLCTDTQENAYVLKLGEDDAPEGIKNLIAVGNTVQDIFASNFVEGRTGNEILKASLEQCKAQGINTSIYTHPIGNHGHGAGPTIGLFDQQDGVPGVGDYILYNNTCYSMELCITDIVPEWDNQSVTLGSETDIAFTDNKVFYLAGRQTALHLIR